MNAHAINMRLVQIIEEAMENLLECRRVLKFTYVHGYYMKSTTEREFFDFLYEGLETSTEELSELLNSEPGTM